MNRDDSSKKKSLFCSFGYVDYIVLASSIAIALGEELGADDLNILATFFAVLSDELALISAVEETCNSNSTDDTVFVAPVPAVGRTYNPNKTVTGKNRIKKRRKKVIHQKIKKK